MSLLCGIQQCQFQTLLPQMTLDSSAPHVCCLSEWPRPPRGFSALVFSLYQLQNCSQLFRITARVLAGRAPTCQRARKSLAWGQSRLLWYRRLVIQHGITKGNRMQCAPGDRYAYQNLGVAGCQYFEKWGTTAAMSSRSGALADFNVYTCRSGSKKPMPDIFSPDSHYRHVFSPKYQ